MAHSLRTRTTKAGRQHRVSPTAIGLAAALICTGSCKTATSEIRSDPTLRETKTIAQDWESRGGQLFIEPSRQSGHLVVRVVHNEQCFETFEDVYATTVTRVTVLDEKDKTTAQSIASGGGVVIALGGLAGLALTPFVLYDTRAKDGAGDLLPVADQSGFALWPIGLSIAAIAVLAGAPALAAPLIAGSQESTVAENEASTKQRREEKANCTRAVPGVNEHLMATIDGLPLPLGTTDDEGKVVIDQATLVAAMLRTSSPTPNAAKIEATPMGAAALITAITKQDIEGFIVAFEAVNAGTGTGAKSSIPTDESIAEVTTWNAEAQRRHVLKQKQAAVRARAECSAALKSIARVMTGDADLEQARQLLIEAEARCTEVADSARLAASARQISRAEEREVAARALAAAAAEIVDAAAEHDSALAWTLLGSQGVGMVVRLRGDERFESATLEAAAMLARSVRDGGADQGAVTQLACSRALVRKVFGPERWAAFVRNIASREGADDPLAASRLIKALNAGRCP